MGFAAVGAQVAKAWTEAFRVGWKVYLFHLKTRRRRNWLGLIWVIVPLLAALGIGLGLQSTRLIGQSGLGGLPPAVFVLTGVTFWQVFADAVLMPQRQLASFQTELAGGHMTVELALLVGLFDLAFAILFRCLFLLLVVPLLGVSPSLSAAALPAFLIVLATGGLAIGIFTALPGMLIDDIGRLLAVLLAVAMFTSPVFYRQLDFIPDWANPLAPVIEAARASATGQPVSVVFLTGCVVVVAAMLVLALSWLKSGQRRFLSALR